MEVETISCPLCQSHDSRPWGTENGFTGVKCTSCGLVYVNPRPTPGEIDDANRIGAHRTAEGALEVAYRPNWQNMKMYEQDIASAFAEEIAAATPISWLDVGAGYGEFVSALVRILPAGSDIRGIEPMLPKVAYAKKMGIPVTDTPLSMLTEQVDVISLMNVFSHIPDFRSFLFDLKRLIKPGGTIFIRTGNGGDLDDRSQYPDKLDFPDHLVFAGEDHLARFLREAGFTVVWKAADRLDTFSWALKSIVKKALGRPSPIILPYRSAFRDVRCRANLT